MLKTLGPFASSNHLADLKKFPSKILDCFEAGTFSVSLIGVKGRLVALDETHKMCINKDMKAAIARPTKAYCIVGNLTFVDFEV